MVNCLLTDILMQKWTLWVCLHGGVGPQVGGVTRLSILISHFNLTTFT